MSEPQLHMEPRHPIGVVSARTGLPQDLIRAWERRYNAVIPQRSGSGRRLYSDQDIERLKMLKRAVAAGRRISDVAGLPVDHLRELIAEDHAEGVDVYDRPAGRVHRSAESAEALLGESLAALESMDRHRLEKALSDAAVSLSAPRLREQLIVPLLHTIGDRWREGSMRIVHEHMATAIVRSFLNAGRSDRPESAPRVLVTTPAGQHHELGALMAAAAAEEAGWNVIYLGPNTPAEEIAAGVRQVGARAVALSISYRDDDRRVQEEIRKLREYLDADVAIFVGGRAIGSLGPAIEAERVCFVPDLAEFQDQLSRIER